MFLPYAPKTRRSYYCVRCYGAVADKASLFAFNLSEALDHSNIKPTKKAPQ